MEERTSENIHEKYIQYRIIEKIKVIKDATQLGKFSLKKKHCVIEAIEDLKKIIETKEETKEKVERIEPDYVKRMTHEDIKDLHIYFDDIVEQADVNIKNYYAENKTNILEIIKTIENLFNIGVINEEQQKYKKKIKERKEREENALNNMIRNMICSGNIEKVNQLKDIKEIDETEQLETYIQFLEKTEQKETHQLRIISFNCKHKKQMTTFYESLWKNIILKRFDIICLQEFSKHNLKELEEATQNMAIYKINQEYILLNENITKRYEIEMIHEQQYNQTSSTLTLQLKNDKHTIYISNSHLPPDETVPRFEELLQELGEKVVAKTMFFGDYNVDYNRQLLDLFKNANLKYQQIEHYSYKATNYSLEKFYDVVNVGEALTNQYTFENGCIVFPFARRFNLFEHRKPFISDHFPVYLEVNQFFSSSPQVESLDENVNKKQLVIVPEQKTEQPLLKVDQQVIDQQVDKEQEKIEQPLHEIDQQIDKEEEKTEQQVEKEQEEEVIDKQIEKEEEKTEMEEKRIAKTQKNNEEKSKTNTQHQTLNQHIIQAIQPKVNLKQLKEELLYEMLQEIKEEVIEDIKKEVVEEIKKELKDTLKRELKETLIQNQ